MYRNDQKVARSVQNIQKYPICTCPKNVQKCREVSRNVLKCPKMSRDVQTLKMSSNMYLKFPKVSETYSKMSRNVQKCLEMSKLQRCLVISK